ncbi:MAG: hypothetical protein ACR2RV_07810 [Verrucomicrobiales bacterium]
MHGFAFMTGRYAIRSGNETVPLGEGIYGLVQWQVTMAGTLAEAGYALDRVKGSAPEETRLYDVGCPALRATGNILSTDSVLNLDSKRRSKVISSSNRMVQSFYQPICSLEEFIRFR